jgi:phosphate uptake regulator
MRRYISTLYKQGFDEIEITFEDSGVVDFIQKELEELLGFEIFNQTEKSCTLKNIAPGLDTEFDNILRRIFLMNVSIAKDSLEAIEGGNFDRLSDIARLEKTNNKLVIFCERLLNKKGYKDHKKLCFLYDLVNQLERVADEYRDICDYVNSNRKAKISKDVLQLYKGCNDLLEFYYKLFYNYNNSEMFKYRDMRIDLETRAFNILKGSNKQPADLILVHYILLIIKVLHHMSIELS